MDSMLINDALERFELIWANVECGITVIDADTREIIDINPVATRMFGGDKSDLIGKRCNKLICPAEVNSCPILDNNQIVDRSERLFVKADGDVIPIIKSVVKISYKGRIALLESFADISNLKKAEEQLRLMHITEQANKAKSDFLSKMSHEMRTPLNAIIGMTKIAESSHDLEKLKYCLATIEQSSAHLLALINDVLDMSKIEAGKFELHNTNLSIEEILKKICNLVMEQVERKRIKLSVFLDKNACLRYIGDDLRISQVITNFMSNAIKFTSADGEITVTAQETEQKDKSSVLRFTITDTGIGITKEQLSKLFNAFEQADANISRRFGGTGLGLVISKNVIDKMHGNIWVESEFGKGSSFIFEIELERVEDIEINNKFADLNGISILVVSNDERICKYFESVISGLGVIMDAATNEEEMISLVNAAYDNENLYDMIFVDYDLSCKDVFDTAKKLYKKTKMGTVVLMASFLKWNKVDAKLRGAGINRFIPMPLFPANIYSSLRREDVGTNNIDTDKLAHSTPDFSSIALLLVEDMKTNREIFKMLFEDTKMKIDTAENGLIAVKKFMQNPDKYDMILMDINMPEMDGYEATRAIRGMEIGKAKTIPIVAMTADAFREDIEKCLNSGMNDHIAKPIDVAEIIRKISIYAGK
ncbi:MAG: response regulator [Synergistaceae bacterium]|nr:response regulator [Synergistaceae bacterium]